jgi:ankyrin repeat protein
MMASQAIAAKVKPGETVTAISEDEWEKFASYVRMDVGEFKQWVGESRYSTQKLRKLFSEDMQEFPLHQAAMNGASALVILVLKKTGPDSVNGRDEHNKTALHYAARIGHMNIVNLLLKEPYVEADLKDDDGLTPLMEAASSGHEKIIERILQAAPGVDVNNTDNSNSSALLVSAWAGHESVVDFLLETEGLGVNINMQDSDGDSALHNAAQMGHAGIVAKVLKAGVDVNLRNSDGQTALHCAVAIRDKDIVIKILEAGVDVNLCNSDDDTTLHCAVQLGDADIAVKILEAGVGVNLRNSDGETALHCAVEIGDENIAAKILEAGVDVNLRNSDGETALHYAAKLGRLSMVELILPKSDASLQDTDGETPLHVAARNGHEDVAEKLIKETSVNVNSTTNHSMTALHFAVWNGHEGVVDKLLEVEDIDINNQDDDGDSPLHYAALNGYDSIAAKILQTKKVDVKLRNGEYKTALHLAVEQGFLKVFDVLTIDQDESVTTYDRDGNSLLHVATESGNEDIVEKIIAKLTVDDVNYQNDAKQTALHIAAKKGHATIITRILAVQGVKLSLKTKAGKTALHLAAAKGHATIVESILAKIGVDVLNAQTKKTGDTALHLAAKNGHETCVQILLKDPRVNLTLKNRDGESLIYIAAKQDSKSMLKMIHTSSKRLKKENEKINIWHECDKDGWTIVHLAAQNRCFNVFDFFFELIQEDFNCVNTILHQKETKGRKTAIDIAVDRDDTVMVQKLVEFKCIKLTATYTEDGKSLLHKVFDMEREEVFKILRRTDEVKDYIESLYKDRQASVDASNAMLVGAALIASVTFAAWLQPPLGYSPYYYEQYTDSLGLAPSVTFNPSYASVEHHPSLEWFWVWNSLSFFFGIATVISGARSVLPARRVFIKQEVLKLRENLVLTAILLTFSMVFVLLAFAMAGVIVLPPTMKYRANMFATIGIGGGVCLLFLVMLVRSIYYLVLYIWFPNTKISKEGSSIGPQMEAATEMISDKDLQEPLKIKIS